MQPRGIGIPYILPSLINSPQELNLYSYVENNPINFTDLNGLRKTIPWVPIYKLACVSGAMAKLVYCINNCKKEFECNKDLRKACIDDCYDTFEFTVEAVCGVKMEGAKPACAAEPMHPHGGGGAGGPF